MSKIIITEQEADVIRNFDATENAVVIPLLWLNSFTFDKKTVTIDSNPVEVYDVKSEGSGSSLTYYYKTTKTSDTPSTKVYTNYSTFAQDVAAHIVSTDDNQSDKSYLMAEQLLLNKMTVVIKPIEYSIPAFEASNVVEDGTGAPYTLTAPTVNVVVQENLYNQAINAALNAGAFNEFKDKNVYNIKFLTTGAHKNVGVVEENGTGLDSYTLLQNIAGDRGDCIACVELAEDIGTDEETILAAIDAVTIDIKKAIMGFPWGVFSGLESGRLTTMPYTYAYLRGYAESVKNNANWFPAAGTTRGEIPGLKYPVFEVGEALMHILQREADGQFPTATPNVKETRKLSVRANCIMNAGVYGYRNWGDFVALPTADTLQTKHVDFLSVNILLCDLHKQLYHAAMRTLFEPNDDIAWLNFKQSPNALMDKMKSGRGLEDYFWQKSKDVEKGEITASLLIIPYDSVNTITINIIPTDTGVEVSEEV